MKNKCKFLIVLTFVIVSIFYRVDSVIAMANERSGMSDADAEMSQSVESEQVNEPVSGAAESEQINEPVSGAAESEQVNEPVSGAAESEQINEPVSGAAESEQIIESTAGSVELEQNVEPASESAEPLQTIESAPDLVSTGSALIEWLESHKSTGGTVKLVDHVVLDGYYCFCPNGMNMPAVHVDTDQYTITVTGEIDLMSDNRLTFSGQPVGNSIFYVAAKGMLSMMGVAVESGQCALWQEEGAGLVVEDCHISGSVHYADTPFVMEQNPVCVVVEKGQTLNDVLPWQISCTVNRQGELSHNEWVPLTWNLEGYDKQQEERRRFQLQGSFLDAASAATVPCTVVYNDYPLTFTDVKASVSGSMYMFRGGYTKPEGDLPIMVISEYSFDEENWITYEETNVTYASTGFFIAFQSEERDAAVYPNIYIRLQWNDNGTRYFSNVLCFAADNLEYVEDIGGSRGGGTSITNPPDEPQKSTGDTASKEGKSTTDIDRDTDTDSGSDGSEVPSDTSRTESGGSSGSEAAGTGQVLSAVPSNIDAGQPANAQSRNNNDDQTSTESKTSDTDRLSWENESDNNVRNINNSDNNESANRNDSHISGREAVAALSVYGENSANLPVINERTLRFGIGADNAIVIAVGFVLLSAIAGIAGFCIHSRSGTNR